MRINHNISALNTYRQLGANSAATNKNIEKLSSGLRINRAGDDAAGLAISEKMRGQIRGLDMAAKNSQDGISLIQTAEGALNETHSILQRMRELANQSANGTNTDADRGALQDEMNQLTSEINRIGNTTEFNTQKLLKGDGKANLKEANVFVDGTLASGATNKTQATNAITITTAAAAGDTVKFTLNGQELNVTFTASTSNGGVVGGDNKGYNVTANSANVAIDAAPDATKTGAGLKDALAKMIEANETLKGQYTVSDATGVVTITAVAGGKFDGAEGNIDTTTETGAIVFTGAADNVGTTTHVKATKTLDFDAAITGATTTATDTNLKALVGTGFTINGQQVEFYNANDGAYTGSGIGVAINTALENATNANKADALVKAIADTVGSKIDGVTLTATGDDLIITAKEGGVEGNKIEYKDGGIQKEFKTSFQIGANSGQAMSLEINDMRAKALGIVGKAGDTGFTASKTVTDGTNDVKGEAALNISTKDDAAKSIAIVDKAIASVSSERSKLGAVQNRLEHTINNLGTASENLTAAESRIRDVDMAKEMMEQTKNNILAQAAQAMLAQANQQPQGVLQLLR
ncbi:flagellin [Paenibacillus methanolicus]|uniref:Flagellin n=1 Tax=Paenibacillus methanolicus TaxID=582686 RepID=A0A5S5C8K6_9BACL|nr:flagellin [Paenibacillus methanolicus]TYP75741.1 flagellin [Paenibacillus methanolicus]